MSFTKKEAIKLELKLEISGHAFNQMHALRKLDDLKQQEILRHVIEEGLRDLFEQRAAALGLIPLCEGDHIPYVGHQRDKTPEESPEAA